MVANQNHFAFFRNIIKNAGENVDGVKYEQIVNNEKIIF